MTTKLPTDAMVATLVDALHWIAEGHYEDLEGTAPGSTPGDQRVGADARNVAKAALVAFRTPTDVCQRCDGEGWVYEPLRPGCTHKTACPECTHDERGTHD